ncbi:MAG: peptidoglycan DD-metalloendopeptidase family protein [Myxococcota bacterium]|nr:peptidoglycan DD-metalloendopeptidase family protein [Myxococcota bacterium]
MIEMNVSIGIVKHRLDFVLGLCVVLLTMVITVAQVRAEPSDIEEAQLESEELFQEENSILDSLDAFDRRVSNLERKKDSIQRKSARRRSEIKEVDERIKQVNVDLTLWHERLKKRLRARSNLNLDDAVWRRLILGTGSQNDWLRRRGYLAAIVKADLGLVKTYQDSEDRLRTLKEVRIGALDTLKANQQLLDVTKQEIMRQRRKRLRILDRLRAQQRVLKDVLHQQALKQRGLAVEALEKAGTMSGQEGRLPHPAEGSITRRFGPYEHAESGAKLVSNGWTFSAPMDTPVFAVFHGKIVHAGWFSGFGNLVIVDHGGGYHTVYAHMQTIHRNKGDRVHRGDMLGKVGDSGSLTGPQLYFEIRLRQKPLDPSLWLFNDD